MENLSAAATIAVRALLTAVSLSMLGGCIYILTMNDIPERNEAVMFSLTGIVATIAYQATQWWFGGSKGSTDQTDALIKKAGGLGP